jgi:hypothetical protein
MPLMAIDAIATAWPHLCGARQASTRVQVRIQQTHHRGTMSMAPPTHLSTHAEHTKDDHMNIEIKGRASSQRAHETVNATRAERVSDALIKAASGLLLAVAWPSLEVSVGGVELEDGIAVVAKMSHPRKFTIHTHTHTLIPDALRECCDTAMRGSEEKSPCPSPKR